MKIQQISFFFKKLLLVIIASGLLHGCQKKDHMLPPANPESATIAHDWYKLQLQILLNSEPQNSVIAANSFGYIGVGLYEATRNALIGSLSLSTSLYKMPQMPLAENDKDYSWAASANAALAQMVHSFFDGLTETSKAGIDSLENAYNNVLKSSIDDATFRRSQAFGRAVASAMIEWSGSDNYNVSNTGYISPTFPGAWQPTPPAFAGALAPFVKDARPFIEKNLHFATSAFTVAYSEDPTSVYYKMAKEVYDISKNLTSQQREAALFWNDEGVRRGYTVPGHSINIVIQLLEKLDLSLAVAAVLYAKAGIALRDAQIVLSNVSYNNPLARPATYIRKLIDPGWLPLVVTPSLPEYPAAHSFITSAVMQVLRREIGYEYLLTDNTYEFLGFGIRNFESYRALAEESGMSGFYGGIHYKLSIELGLSSGQDFGNRVADIRVTPPI